MCYELEKMEKMVMSVWDIGCTNEHCKLVHKIIGMLVKEVEKMQLSDEKELEVGYTIVWKSSSLLQMLEQQIKQILKYNMLVQSEQNQNIQTPLQQIYTRNNLLLSSCFILIATTHKSSLTLEPFPSLPLHIPSTFSKNNPLLTSYLNQLTLALQTQILSIPKKKHPLEKAVYILTVLSKQSHSNTRDYYKIQLELIKCNRLLAERNNQMIYVWKNNEEQQQQIQQNEEEKDKEVEYQIEYRKDYMKMLVNVLEKKNLLKEMEKVGGMKESTEMGMRVYLEAVECFGNMQTNVSVNSLAKTQHLKQVRQQLEMYTRLCCSDDSILLLEKQIRVLSNINMQLHSQALLFHLQSSKLYSHSYCFPSDQTLYQLLPPYSSFLLIHINPHKTILYVAFITISSQNKDYQLIKKHLSPLMYAQLQSIIQNINLIKSNTIKIPIVKKYQNSFQYFQKQTDLIYNNLIKDLEEFCQFFTSQIAAMINDQMSLSVIVDQELEAVPFEDLKVFQNMRARSKDFSLYQLAKKYEKEREEKQKERDEKESSAFISYDFKRGSIQDRINNSNLKYEQDSKIASLGEWQYYFNQKQALRFYSHHSLLQVLPPYFLIQMIHYNQVSNFILLDNLNNYLDLINHNIEINHFIEYVPAYSNFQFYHYLFNKYEVNGTQRKNIIKNINQNKSSWDSRQIMNKLRQYGLNQNYKSKQDKISMEEENIIKIQLLNMLGFTQIILNRWSMSLEENPKDQLDQVIENCTLINKNNIKFYRENMRIYGVPRS